MNILVVCHYGLYMRPEASFVHAQVQEYVKLGHRVRVLVPVAVGKSLWAQGRWKVKSCVVDGVELFPMRYLSFFRYGNWWFNTASASACLKGCVSRLLNDFRPDVIHAHTLGFDSKLGALLKERLHVPLVVTTHGSDVSLPYEQGQITRLRPTCNRADTIVAVSTALGNKVKASGTDTPIRTILNGFRFSNVCSPCCANPYSVIQVGQLSRQKRVHQTIEAFAQVKPNYHHAVLTIVGEGPERKNLEEQCKTLGISDSVRFLGHLPNNDTLQVMAQHTIFVMPSVREGFGIVYLEAMASGCLTIGTQKEGIADFIREGENGFLIPPESPGAIAERISWCFDHPEETNRIAQQGRQDALTQTWEKNALEYQDLFTNLLKGH